MSILLQNKKRVGLGVLVLALLWAFLNLLVGPTRDSIAELEEKLPAKRRMLVQVTRLREKLVQLQQLTGGQTGGGGMSLETRLENLVRPYGNRGNIRTERMAQTGRSRVTLTLSTLTLIELVEFMKKVEALPPTIQLERVQINKTNDRGQLILVMSELAL